MIPRQRLLPAATMKGKSTTTKRWPASTRSRLLTRQLTQMAR